ncbi:MAG TPA: hypothetical protein VHP83_27835 [Aggregatilineaceae bacterium]|nr:hypothetical protein [Aggregatilineaceae bacterium]
MCFPTGGSLSDPHLRSGGKRRSPGYWLAVLLLGLTGVIGAAVVVVRLQPLDTAWAAPGENCDGPCWLGVRAGKTRIGEAIGLLRQAGIRFEKTAPGPTAAINIETPNGWLEVFFYPGFNGFKADNRIMSVCLTDEERQGNLSVATLLAALGTPDEVRPGGIDGGRLRLTLRYTRRQAEALLSVPLASAHLDLFTPLDMLCFLTDPMFFYTAAQIGHPIQSVDWRGVTLTQYFPDVLRADIQK